jgi:hypothetical protein
VTNWLEQEMPSCPTTVWLRATGRDNNIFRAARYDWVAHVQGTLCLEKIGFVSLNQGQRRSSIGRMAIEGSFLRNEPNFLTHATVFCEPSWLAQVNAANDLAVRQAASSSSTRMAEDRGCD